MTEFKIYICKLRLEMSVC